MTDTAIAYTIDGAGKASGLGRTSLYEELDRGREGSKRARPATER